MDYYLDSNNVYARLLQEYFQHGRLIICVDFDDTLYDYHKKGNTYDNVIQLLKRWQNYADIIVWTGNGEEQYEVIKQYCNDHGISIYGINCDSRVKVAGRKIYANVYLDDRSGLAETYDILLRLLDEIESGKE
jgi:hypothetical protein